MAMEKKAGVLEVNYRSEGSGVEVGVLFELEVGWEGRAANSEVAFKGFKSGIAD